MATNVENVRQKEERVTEEQDKVITQPEAVMKRQRRSHAQNDDTETLEQKLERLQKQVDELTAQKNPTTCCEHLFGMIDAYFKKRGELRVYKLKKHLEPYGYRYQPIDEKGNTGDFVIEGTRKDNSVMFVFKKSRQNDDTIPGGTVCACVEDVICKAEVTTETDWLRAEAEMVYKFNAVTGRRRNIIIGM